MREVLFPLIGGGQWLGGANYLRNTLSIITRYLSEEVRASVGFSRAQAAEYGAEFESLVGGRVLVDDAFAEARKGQSLVKSSMARSYGPVVGLVKREGFDVLFENAAFYGWSPDVPCLSWIPDFQHRHLPKLFSRSGYIRRELGFKAQLRAKRTLMLSSEAARTDLKTFYGRSEACVVRFAVNMPIREVYASVPECLEKYGLNDPYFYMPNQIWVHKNHRLVVDALRILKQDGRLARTLPIVFSGHNVDPRSEGHFDRLMEHAAACEVASHFRYLKTLPYADVLALNAGCASLINPSLFEGWATTIEEAKALGTPLLLSDLRIHREQAPTAGFFGSAAAAELADLLYARSQEVTRPRAFKEELVSDHEVRLRAHADSLGRALEAAAA